VTTIGSGAVPVLTCTSGAPWEPALVRGLQRRELGVEVVRRCVDHGELVGVAERDRPRAVIVAGGLPWLDRDLVATLQEQGVTVIAVGGAADRALGTIGIALHLPVSASVEEVAGVLHRLERDARSETTAPVVEPVAPARGGRLVAVWGAGGAPGRTAVAVHLAVALGAGARVLIADADVWSASIAQLLELDESPSIARAARLAGDGWPEPLAACLQRGPGDIAVLAGLPRAELWPEVREHAWRAVLEAARAEADVVVLDLAAPIEEDEELSFDRVPHRRNLVTRVALEDADEVLLVTGADPIALRRGIVAHRSLVESLPRAAGCARVVLNGLPRSARRAQEASAAISEWTGSAPVALLPAEPDLGRVRWEGRPLQEMRRRSPWLRELAVVATAVHP